MTQTPGESNEPEYPTDWHRIDDYLSINSRQTGLDTFQLTNRVTTYTVNKEGFDIFRENPFPVFKQWLWDNKIKGEDFHE